MDEKKTSNRPFSQLSDEEQKAAIDVAVALSVIAVRIPSVQKALTDYIVTEFTSCHNLSPNIAKYAFRELGANLFNQDWHFGVTKAGERVTTQFQPLETSGGTNGQIIIQP